ncbi:hypothetical protein V5O48_019630, partial [Marasmius crinis-equi]
WGGIEGVWAGAQDEPEAQQDGPSETAGKSKKPKARKEKRTAAQRTQSGQTANKRKHSGGTDMEETPEEERPVKKSRKGKAPEPKPHKTPEPKPHTETGIQEELDGVVVKGKKGKDTD